MQYLGLIDLVMAPIVLVAIILHAYYVQSKRRLEKPVYRFYVRGTIFKLVGTLGFCGIYLFYYSAGGDTLAYHQNATSLVNLLFLDFGRFADVMFSSKPEYFAYFTEETGKVYEYHFVDPATFNVSRVMVLFELLTFKSYIASCFLASYVCFRGLWKLFLVFTNAFRGRARQLFWAILAVPSVTFWSGGLSKEIIIIYALGMSVYSLNQIFFDRKRVLANVFLLLIVLYLIISVKPYIFVALFPATFIWFIMGSVQSVRSTLLRVFLFPIILGGGIVVSSFAWQQVSGLLGDYSSIDSMIEKAVITKEDLQHERYEGQSFDIGDFPPTVQGALSKFPQATIAGLYRPFITEANNVVMVFSSLENLVVLLLSIFALFKLRKMAREFGRRHILYFSLIFSLIFAFAIGLSTSNFGALVRFKIPLLPLFIPMLVVIVFDGPKLKRAAA